MPPLLALVLTIGFSLFMLQRYARGPLAEGDASWLPVVWIFFIASRFPSQWMALLGLPNLGGSLEEGSPLDAAFFLCLIVLGSIELKRRNVRVSILARENVWLTVFFAYCFLAIFWSDFPFVAFKRWIKTIGHPVMALLILTEPNPTFALRIVLKRAAFIMLPLSVLFIKYFPQYGRGFEAWSGLATNRGITINKNELGYHCFIFGMFFVWNFILARRYADKQAKRRELLVTIGFLGMILWLLRLANSATSLVTLLIGSALIIGLGFSFVSKRYFGTSVIIVVLLAGAAEATVGVYEPILHMLGRNPTLTDRTEVWADTLSLMDSPVFGTGFESFWLGHRLQVMWAKWFWHPNEAHNGYLETYLNLGAVGVVLLLVLLLSTFRKISAKFSSDFDFARLRMGFLFAIIFYNFTEATFKAVSFVYTMFYLIALDIPQISLETDTRDKPVSFANETGTTTTDDKFLHSSAPPVLANLSDNISAN